MTRTLTPIESHARQLAALGWHLAQMNHLAAEAAHHKRAVEDIKAQIAASAHPHQHGTPPA